jgi:hypothetical protein
MEGPIRELGRVSGDQERKKKEMQRWPLAMENDNDDNVEP